VTISFDPRETPDLARSKKAQYLRAYGRPDAEHGWHFLTGDEQSIHALAQAVGFHYVYDEETKQFAHASGIMVLTKDGVLARYMYGIEYPPKDMRFALIDASRGNIGTPVDKLVLLCYHYDPSTGKYGLIIMNIIRAAGAVTLLALAGFMVVMFRRDRRKTHMLPPERGT
jgi:protein SCO1/2